MSELMGPESGSETSNKYQQLLGANREQIGEKVFELAKKYVVRA